MIAENPGFLLWIATTVGLCWILPGRALPFVLVATCGAYLVAYSPWSLLALAMVTACCGLTLIYGKGRHGYVLASIAFSCALFIAYRAFRPSSGLNEDVALLGFAFYILRAIHILLESYSGRLKTPGWAELICWLWFLPTLQVGPIHRFQPFQRDLVRRRWDADLFAKGLQRILFGFLKIVFLANYLVGRNLSGALNGMDPGSWWYHYLDSLKYGLILYFKFAGYSDIAIGFSLLIGFRVMENFNYPFLAQDISDFWRRWHISLSSWCRDYVYMPVFAMTRIPAVAAVATMLVLGLWHEVSVRYLLWGLWHGVGIAVCQQWQRSSTARVFNSGLLGKIWSPLAAFVTLNFVILSFVITSAASLADMWQRWRVLLWISP